MRLADLKRVPRLRLAAVALWAIFAAIASAQAGDFGQYPVIKMPEEEVQASQYFFDHAPVNSTLVETVANFPSRLDGNYVLHNMAQMPNDPALSGYPQFGGNKLEHMNTQVLALSVTDIAKGPAFLVVAPSMYPYIAYYNSYAAGTLPTLVRRLENSDYWKLWYQQDGTYIFQAIPQGIPAKKK